MARRPPTHPIPLKFHKKKVQLQLDYRPPYEEEEGERRTAVQGSVFLSIAKAADETGGRMDWEGATSMKLGPADIAQIVTGLRSRSAMVDLFHQPPGSTRSSSLQIEPGKNAGTYRWTLTVASEGQKDSRIVYLDTADTYLLVTCLEAALPKMMGW
jgi:hypothetical protein